MYSLDRNWDIREDFGAMRDVGEENETMMQCKYQPVGNSFKYKSTWKAALLAFPLLLLYCCTFPAAVSSSDWCSCIN